MNFRTLLNSTFSILLPIFFLSNSLAASFDCAKAGNDIEKRICSNEQISSLDSDLGAAYKRAIAKTPNLKESQLVWIKERNKCSDDECIVKLYKERISFLNNLDNPQQDTNTSKSEVTSAPPNTEEALKIDNLKIEQAKDKDEKAFSAMADAQALREKLKQENEADEKEPPIIGIILALTITFLFPYGLYRLVTYLKNKTKDARAKSAIKKKYKNLSIINGSDIDGSKFSNSHIKEIKIKSSKILRTEVFFLEIPYSDINSSHFCYWKGQKGEVNEGLYSNAMQTYQLAKQQYDFARDAAQRAQKPFRQSPPSSPNRSDFVSYYPVNGSSSVSLKHGITRLLSEITFSGRNNNNHTINLDQFSTTIDKIYKEILENILSGKLNVSPDSRLIKYENPSDDDVLSRITKKYVNALYSDAQSSIGAYSSDIDIYQIQSELNRNDVSLNIVLTISSLKSEKFVVTLHDYLTPDVILEKFKSP